MTGVWRVKPGTAEMELDMSVQADSENFDTDVDLDKVLSTLCRPPVANGYAVGILIRNEAFGRALGSTPLTNICNCNNVCLRT
ncbi:hypothetical protein HanXRQr2_Chr07g0282661 [Helianthus annuus]|uniref:Uncharacterized protein n=1 Tax=Helianthus annuus TaxID=4232 RepID=A0A251UCP3_HELAN|nr:hypothetical protein HanXRQr2_Chr07g0282661 [Helianthus annuus]KAJ0903745.1 hypothetical protein HanPSC8_Chr07g0273471 [Helianthus annuus]